MAASMPQSLPGGFLLQGYKLLRVLGAGGFGITYLAFDPQLDRKVAIKEFYPNNHVERKEGIAVVPRSTANQDLIENGLERFALEGQTLAQFRHPAIVGIIHSFRANGTAYLVMDYEVGVSLTQFIKKHKSWFGGVHFTNEEIFRFIRPLCAGLELIHAANIIHRDIKPDNIIIRANGTPVLLDFGAARRFMMHQGKEDSKLTVIATPANAPPEQFMEDGDQGPWTDIYALGTVLYQMLTDTPPPSSGKRIKELTANRPDPLIPIAKILEGRYSARLLGAIDQAMAIDYEKRPKNIQEWLQLLRTPGGTTPNSTQVAAPAQQLAANAQRALVTKILNDYRHCLLIAPLLALLLAPLFCLAWQTSHRPISWLSSWFQPSINHSPNVQSQGLLQLLPSVNAPQPTDATTTVEHFPSLTVNTVPKEAQVRILNINPKYQHGIKLTPGSYHIEVYKAGYRTSRQWVQLAGDNVTLDVTLQPE
ncbi:MAG: serine/threonine protein kinase [Nitrospirae bacterium]|nr:serine/threonine protein kinase [Magnetococcales bacterium]